MRDIRGDLQERVKLVSEQIKAAEQHYDALVEQLAREHEARVEALKSELDAVRLVTRTEDRRIGGGPAPANGEGAQRAQGPAAPPPIPHAQPQAQIQPGNFLLRKVAGTR